MVQTPSLKFPLIRSLVLSSYLDIFGAILIFGVCYVLNFHGTIYEDGEIQFGIPFQELWTYIRAGAYPLGIFSTLGAIFSMLATRFTGKQKNSGNALGIITTVNSGANDFMFGNASAIITYPISFLLHSFSFFKWYHGEEIRKIDRFYFLIVIIGIIIGFGLVYFGAYLFGGRTDFAFLNIVAITFGLSLGANFSNAFKYEETWLSWAIYNVIQLVKAFMQLNLANVVKYIFYLVNSAITLADWKWNGDRYKYTDVAIP